MVVGVLAGKHVEIARRNDAGRASCRSSFSDLESYALTSQHTISAGSKSSDQDECQL